MTDGGDSLSNPPPEGAAGEARTPSGKREVLWIDFFLRRLAAMAVIIVTVAIVRFWLSTPSPRPPVDAAGAEAGLAAVCPPDSRKGRAKLDDDVRTADGLKVAVRTPKNYDATRGYPLIVVYPPAGMNPRQSETFYDLTTEATRRGFIVAYSDHRRLTREGVAEQAKVAAAVQQLFCVDANAISFLGHSDGGSIAQGLVTFAHNAPAPAPRAIVASAAGVTRTDLAGARAACPRIPAVMIAHSRLDRMFPDFGRGAAEYWRSCASCAPMNIASLEAGCREYRGCAEGRRVVYCETAEPHDRWPGLNAPALDFLQGKPLPDAAP